MSELPEGVTDDMSIPLPKQWTIEDIRDFVIQAALTGTNDDDSEEAMVAKFGLSQDDASFARDRIFGGIVRAAIGGRSNRPSAKKDPFAYSGFMLATQNPEIIARIYPQFVQAEKRPWWKFW